MGVITFSIAQENAIREELKHEVEKPDSFLNPFLEFLNEDSSADEPFFIKSLERVQGDERDSIIISIGYGPDAQRKITQNFGPINTDGGERRLNVAITRSKRELCVVASLASGDIRITEKSQPGLRDLKRFLEYCQGMGEIYNKALELKRVAAAFEASVKKAIEEMGFVVDENVGLGNYPIDLGVRNPDRPDEYIVAIICDGNTYASAKIARDRDWLREQILKKMGWKKVIHLWSKEWMDQPDQALLNLQKEIEELCVGRNLVDISPKDIDNKPKVEKKAAEQSISQTQIPGPVDLEFKLQLQKYIYYSPDPKNGLIVSLSGPDFIEEIVRIEQPIHQNLLLERWETYFDLAGLSKNKRRILFSEHLTKAIQSKMVVLRDDFIELPEREEEIIPRIPPAGQSPRNIEHIALIEIAALSRQILIHVDGISKIALARKTCQILGFQAFTEYRHTRIDAAIDWMVEQENGNRPRF